MRFDDPETAVARDVTEVAAFTIDRADDDALAGVAFDHSAVARTVFVIRGGEERFHLFDVGFFHSGEFSDFDHPEALQFFRSGFIVHIRQREGFGVVFGCDEVFYDGTLADALLAVKYRHTVELYAGTHHPRNSGGEGFSRDGTDILRIVSLQIFDEQFLDTLHTVPLGESVEVIPHRMKMAVICHLGEGYVIVAGRELAVADIHEGLELGRVGIPPEGVSFGTVPRQFACDLDAVCHVVESKSLQVRVVFEDEVQVPHAVFQCPGMGNEMKPLVPVGIIGEVLSGLSDTLGGKIPLDRIVRKGEFDHLLEGLLLVIIAEAVDADEVKSVQQFAAGGVRGVVAVCKLVIIDHDTGR